MAQKPAVVSTARSKIRPSCLTLTFSHFFAQQQHRISSSDEENKPFHLLTSACNRAVALTPNRPQLVSVRKLTCSCTTLLRCPANSCSLDPTDDRSIPSRAAARVDDSSTEASASAAVVSACSTRRRSASASCAHFSSAALNFARCSSSSAPGNYHAVWGWMAWREVLPPVGDWARQRATSRRYSTRQRACLIPKRSNPHVRRNVLNTRRREGETMNGTVSYTIPK